MTWARSNVVLLMVFVALLVGNWLVKPNFTRLNPDLLVDMARSTPYDSFAPNENFTTAQCPSGMTLREPASGTIIFGKMPLHYGTATSEAVLAGEQLTNPFLASDSTALERGAVVFSAFCFPCHGPLAKGDGIVPTRGFPPPPSIVTGKYLTYKDGQIFHIMTYGMNNMPSYAKQILANDRWKTILYVRTLQQRAVEEEQAAKMMALKQKQTLQNQPASFSATATDTLQEEPQVAAPTTTATTPSGIAPSEDGTPASGSQEIPPLQPSSPPPQIETPDQASGGQRP